MGRIYAPSLADLKQGFDEVLLEQQIQNELPAASYFLKHYWRYLDDIHIRWRLQWIHLFHVVERIMNSIDENIQYEFQVSYKNLKNASPFLDVKIIIKDGATLTDIYSKDTDTFNYLPFNSCHPRHITRNIPFVLARRIRGIVSDPALVLLRMEEMKLRLIPKGYPKQLISESIRKAMAISRDSILAESPQKLAEEQEHVYFVSTYNPLIENPLKQVQMATDIFNSTQPENKKIKVKSSFRRSPTLKDTLMFKKSGDENSVNKCLTGCILCGKYLHTGRNLKLKDGQTLTANARFDCLSRNLLYAGLCLGCLEFYLGETGDQINSRFTVHRFQGKAPAHLQPVKADLHFNTCGKGNYKVFPFKRLKKNCTIYRRTVENHYIKRLKPKLNALQLNTDELSWKLPQ